MTNINTDLLKKLESGGLRITPQRLAIYNELADSKSHPDAKTVYERLRNRVPGLSLDTVYRNLRLFEKHGFINRLGSAYDGDRFDADTSTHWHFVCRRCGKIDDIHCKNPQDYNRLPPQVYEYGKPEESYMEIRGICRECAGKPDCFGI